MEEMDGLEAARWLRENGSKACIVFLTGYPEYSIEGYKVDAHRYLLKNAENIKEALNECLSSALEKMQKDEKKIDLDVQGGILSIAPSKIVYAERTESDWVWFGLRVVKIDSGVGYPYDNLKTNNICSEATTRLQPVLFPVDGLIHSNPRIRRPTNPFKHSASDVCLLALESDVSGVMLVEA